MSSYERANAAGLEKKLRVIGKMTGLSINEEMVREVLEAEA